jgi:hypothetical protein
MLQGLLSATPMLPGQQPTMLIVRLRWVIMGMQRLGTEKHQESIRQLRRVTNRPRPHTRQQLD